MRSVFQSARHDSRISQTIAIDDLRGSQMLHAIEGPVVVREMVEECVSIELRRSPHRDFRIDNPAQVAHEIRPLAPFVASRMHNNTIVFSARGELIKRPVRADFGRAVDQHFVVRMLPLRLILTLRSTVDRAPSRGRLDAQLDGILLVSHDVHEDFAAVEIPVCAIELSVGPRQIISENLVGHRERPVAACFHTPRLAVGLLKRQCLRTGCCREFLDVFCKVRIRVASGLP